MAGDWIPMVHGLADSLEVIQIAARTRPKPKRKHTPNTYETVGALHRVWCIADAQTDDGKLIGYTPEYLDSQIGIPGFSQAMADVGWLKIEPQALVIPHFSEHMGRSAKRRLKDGKRLRDRSGADVSDSDCTGSPASQAGISRTPSGDCPQQKRPTEQNRTEQVDEENNNRQTEQAVVAVVPMLEKLGYDTKAVLAIAQHPNCTPEQIAIAVKIADQTNESGEFVNRAGLIRRAIEGGWELPIRVAAESHHDAVEARRLARVAEDAAACERRIARDDDFNRKRVADRAAFNKLTQDQQGRGFKRYLEALSPNERRECEHRPRIAFAGEIVKLMGGGGFLEATP